MCINNIGDEGALYIAAALQVNPFNSVQKLSLSYNGISEAGGTALGNSLLINRSLKILVLSGNIIRDVGCTAIARALRVNNSLEELELAQETFGTSALGELALALRENKIMRRLRIEYAEEAKQGVFAIAEALRDCPRMHVFTLESYNEVQGWCNTGITYPQPCLKHGYERLGLPQDASNWSNEEILQYFHELHVDSVLAFGMGQNVRLGYASLVRYLEEGVIDIVMRAYFGLPL